MIKLLKNANVYAPEKLGKKDILIEGEKILLMQDTIEGYEGFPGVETYDLEGKTQAAAESRGRHPVYRNPSSVNSSKMVLPR